MEQSLGDKHAILDCGQFHCLRYLCLQALKEFGYQPTFEQSLANSVPLMIMSAGEKFVFDEGLCFNIQVSSESGEIIRQAIEARTRSLLGAFGLSSIGTNGTIANEEKQLHVKVTLSRFNLTVSLKHDG